MTQPDSPCQSDLLVDSLWILGPRAKGGKHSNVYHGNFAPQIPNQMIRRFTQQGDIVLEPFMGSGTTLYECENLSRRYIGFDINPDIVQYVKDNMHGSLAEFSIHEADTSEENLFEFLIRGDLQVFGSEFVDQVILHPPYLDIIKFTDKKGDLSQIGNLDDFTTKFLKVVKNCFDFLRPQKHMILVAGDIYKNGEVLPLAFHLMQNIRQSFPCSLKGIIVKDIVGNRAKIGTEDLWRSRAIKFGNYLFKHEYIFVFKKQTQKSR